VRLFLDWLDTYHEAHFAVIREIYKNEGPTRYDIWAAVYGAAVPRDDSAQADLYKMLIRDLSQAGDQTTRESDGMGRFVKQRRAPRRGGSGNTMESAFEDSKTYVLTELGSQFCALHDDGARQADRRRRRRSEKVKVGEKNACANMNCRLQLS